MSIWKKMSTIRTCQSIPDFESGSTADYNGHFCLLGFLTALLWNVCQLLQDFFVELFLKLFCLHRNCLKMFFISCFCALFIKDSIFLIFSCILTDLWLDFHKCLQNNLQLISFRFCSKNKIKIVFS